MASPSVVGTPTETAISTASTSHTVDLPAGATGNLLIAIMSKGSAGTTPTVNALAGWNELLDEAQTLGLYIAWRTCDGTEGATTTFTLSSSTRGAWIVYEISGHADPATQPPQIGTTASGSSTSPDPPSVSVTGGSKDILTIACFGRSGEEADDDTWVTSAPSGFGGLLQKACGTAGTNLGGMVATAHLAQTTATANPAAFTAATGAWRAQTIVVHPPPPPTQTAVAEVSLGSGSTPATRTAHSIKVRARTTAGAGTIKAALYEGATNRSGDLETSALTTSLADYTLSIPDASAANITDYSNLAIRFWGYAAGGGSIVFEVDQLYLEIPASAGIEKTGFGKTDPDGYGVSSSLAQEVGRGVAGLVGAGASASLTQETGFATVGTVGSGTSAKVSAGVTYTKAGYGVAGDRYDSAVLADSPYLYWRLDETTGTIAADASGNGRTGTYTGGPTLGQSPLVVDGSSVDFTTSQYVINSAVVNTSDATVEVWFDYDGTPPSGHIDFIAGFNEGNGSGTGDKQILLNSSGQALFYVYDGAPQVAVGATVLSAGRHHLVGTVDDAGNVAKIYVDGVEDGSIAASSSFSGYSNPNIMVAGSSVALGTEQARAGKRDEFAVYTTALSPAQILNHYQRGIAGRGLVGSGVSASIDQESGAGVAGLVGSAASASLMQETGAGISGLVGAGVSESQTQETGTGAAGLVGAGVSASVNQETGSGVVGAVGSGASQLTSGGGTTYNKSGYATVGEIGAGRDVDIAVESGAGIAGLVGKGADAVVAAETGRGVAGLVGSGADVDMPSETGRGVAGTVGAGAGASVFVESGFGAVGTTASGSKTRGPRIAAAGLVWLFGDALQQAAAAENTGAGISGLVGSGASASVYVESGHGALGELIYGEGGFGVGVFGGGGLIGSGVSQSITQETGAGKVGAVGAGALQGAKSRAGAGVAGLVGSGADAVVDTETGFGKAGTVGAGASASIHVKAGFGTVGTVGAGSSARSGVKRGAGVAGLVGAGRDAMVDTERGAGIAGTVGAGSNASVYVERGFGKVGAVGAGSSDAATLHVKAGFGRVGAVASGGRVREHATTGYGTAGTIAVGTKLRVLTREGVAVVTLVGAGLRNGEYAQSGYATVGGDGYGIADQDVFLTLLSPIHTGRIADGWNGSVDGGEQGHIADTVGGVMDEELEEVFV